MMVIAALGGLLLGIGVILVERRAGWRVGLGLSVAFVLIALATWKATDIALTTTLAVMLGFAAASVIIGLREALIRSA